MTIRERTAAPSPARELAEGNARMTAATAVILLVLSVIQVGTAVAGVQAHLTLHVIVGLLLVPPLLVKIASVSWRFLGYYRHDQEYRRKGPPARAKRIMGPFLLLTTLVLFTSGFTLLLAPSAFGGPRGIMFRVHDLSFYLWTLLVIVHVAGHARDLRRLSARDWRRRTRATVRGARSRQAIALASLAAGLALALSLVGHVGTFQNAARHAAGTAHQPGHAAPARPAPSAGAAGS